MIPSVRLIATHPVGRKSEKRRHTRPAIAERIFKGEFSEIKTLMSKSRELGMQTFDWALFDLYSDNQISYE